ncbi:MAG: hypothetical protein HKN20_06655 [Gemmatimonadetes bacterium]|nr:hypothetical protein [Gemmatimonadota bacterium]
MFNAKKLTIALAVPALLGLAFVTAESGDYKKSSGSSSCQSATKQASAKGSCTSTKQASGSTCSSTKASVKQASAKGASCSSAQKASASCSGAKATVKQASAGAGCCASGAKVSTASASCATAANCAVSIVKAEDGIRIYALGDEAGMKEWLETVATDLRENRNLNVEIFEAKGGSYMLVKSTASGATGYTQLMQAAAGDQKCMAVCAANGCPPKA